MKAGVLLYEDNKDLSEAIVQLLDLSDHLFCVGSFRQCTDVLNDVERLKPQVILMDIEMPAMNGIEAVRLIRQVNKTVKIIMLTVFDDNQSVLDAIVAGASGYILKKQCFEKLFDAIDESLAGGAPLSASIASMILKHVAHNSPTGTTPDHGLTARELEILQSLVKGLSYKMIAASLFISFETVKTHIRNIYEKLQVHSQSEAVAKALRNKIV